MQALLREGQEATFRGSYARLSYSRVSQFLAASLARFRDFPKFGTFGGCASGERAGQYSESSRSTLFPLTVTQIGGPSGPACCFVFSGTGLGTWGTPVGPTPRRAQVWLDRASLGGGLRQSPNRPIADRIRRRRGRPGRRLVRRFRLRRIGRVRRLSPRRRLPCRDTPLHWAAGGGQSASIAELLLCGADGAVHNYWYRCAAPHSRNRKPQQPRARRRTPKQVAERNGELAAYEAGERLVHSARRLTAPATPPMPRAPSLPALLVPSVFAVGARRSSGEGGDRQRSTRTVTGALAARLVVHYRTRGSKCRTRRPRAADSIGSAKRARARSAVRT
jgi:hypothetical protein